MSSAIDWFFEHEPEGVILEDDVVPEPSFWPYCAEMLARYRDDPRVMAINGSNLVEPWFQSSASYFFSRFVYVWGWASWRRAWKFYDVSMRDWPTWRDTGGLARVCGGDFWFERYWRATFQVTYDGTLNTWDNQWQFTLWKHGGLSVTPAYSQISNIGFGADATHTASTPAFLARAQPRSIPFPLAHPASVHRCGPADAIADRQVYSVGLLHGLRRELRAVPLLSATAAKAKRSLQNIANRIRRG